MFIREKMTPVQTDKKIARKKALRKVFIFGVMSISLYVALFANMDLVMKYFTKGGFYAILPIITVLIFSYALGSFTSNILTALGVMASSTTNSAKAESENTH